MRTELGACWAAGLALRRIEALTVATPVALARMEGHRRWPSRSSERAITFDRSAEKHLHIVWLLFASSLTDCVADIAYTINYVKLHNAYQI